MSNFRTNIAAAAAFACGMALAVSAHAQLADQPINAAGSQPANVLLSLSVEWPTGNVQAYNDETSGTGCPGRDGGRSACYFDPVERAARINAANATNPAFTPLFSFPYQGYFDPWTCYDYNAAGNYFEPAGRTQGYTAARRYDNQPPGARARCNGQWSGNFLNWATMQTIDMFRWAMTGGDRRIDTADMTVLQKARHDGTGGTGQFPIKQIGRAFSNVPITRPEWVTPYNWNELYLRIQGLNTGLRVSTHSDMRNPQSFDVSVQVCVPGALMDTVTTCTQYGDDSFKPTGLIQENADVVRFSAFGYLLDNSNFRDGGVMRARMKFVGPRMPVLSAAGFAPNPNAEWRESDGTFVLNPDPADAAATSGAIGATITQSGVIQYLNRFGRLNGYKGIDPVSELFYEGLRYYKNIGRTPEYANFSLGDGGSPVRKADGFPVITDWDDPLEPPPGFEAATEWCPKNFMIGISDANTHKDKRLPGNTATDQELAAQPSNPDTTINVTTLLNEIIATEQANEGVTLRNAWGGVLTPGSVNCCQGSAYLAALAYHANTTDIRPEAGGIHTLGKQTVKTFFVDVREAGSWGTGQPRTAERRRNQLWLAAKYGGFKDQNNDGKLSVADAIADLNGDGITNVRDVWDANGDWLPDTYFEADSPEALVNGLRSAFAAIRAEIATNAAVGVSGTKSQLQADTGLYQSSFDPIFWSGDVLASQFDGFDEATGNVQVTPVWSAAERLAQQNWDSGRVIATSSRASANASWGGGRPFRWLQLTDWQREMLNEDEAMLQYLRGRQDDARFRTRLRSDNGGLNTVPAVLGDIVDSSPRYVGAPAARLSDLFNPGYAAFAEAKKNRQPVIFVGANDGMLHAFDARTDHPDGGRELWAYVPSFLFGGVTDPAVDGLRALSERHYVHRYFVNATPTVAEVDFARTNGSQSSGDWRTILVGGLGKGGRGFYALDITDAAAITSESALANKVLWEFSHPTMGFSYGKPQVVKTKRWGWVVLLTSGMDNNAANGSTGGGKGYLYVVNPTDGALLQPPIPTLHGSNDDPAGLAEVTAYAPNGADATVTEVYGGDLLGNVWRFDFDNAQSDVGSPKLFAQLIGPDGPQPITTGPIVRVAPVSRKRYVFVGTGKMLEPSDPFSDDVQSFYALRDGTRLQRWNSGDLGAPTFPITRAKMLENTDLLVGVVANPAKPGGWFFDLPFPAERVLVDPQDTDIGKISWLGSAPNAVGLCSGAGTSRVYVAGYESGQSQLFKENQGTLERIPMVDPGTSGVGLQLVRVDNNIRALVTGSQQSLRLTQGYLQYMTPRTLNWREITEPDD